MLDSTPMNTMMKVMPLGGDTLTSLRIRAFIRPADSATPTPIMAISATATTLKLAKLSTNELKMKRMPSAVSRLSTSMRSSTISYSRSR
jgi:hypothetical protein